jgi:GDP-4-dehydro-6-deoxy-D-mannose reductase
MTTLLTGANSFTGRHLVAHLLTRGTDRIIACVRPGAGSPSSSNSAVLHVACDVSDPQALDSVIAQYRPSRLFHLAACNNENDPTAIIRTNLEGTHHLLTACRNYGAGAAGILIVGSAAGFGEMHAEEVSLAENRVPDPASYYGWSREAQLGLARVAARKWGLPVFLCRPFNLIGPGLGESYAPTRLARQLITVKEAGRNTLALPNCGVVRDFVDVRDAVTAYTAIVERGRSCVPYHVASGRAVTLAELVQHLADALDLGLDLVPTPGEKFENRSAILRSVADTRLIRRDTGWEPSISLTRSIADLIEGLVDAG